MDFQCRVVIPKDLLEICTTACSNSFALCHGGDDKIFYLIATNEITEEDMVLAVVKTDAKGRFNFPKRLLKHYKIEETAQELIFIEKKKIFISFV